MTVYLGPPTTGRCVACDKLVYKQGGVWWDDDGFQGDALPDGYWHNHLARPARPIETVLMERTECVPVLRR